MKHTRISKENVEKYDVESLADELFESGREGNISGFKYFKEVIKKELPDFTEEEILKIDANFQKIRELYSFRGHYNYFTLMEYEQHKKTKHE